MVAILNPVYSAAHDRDSYCTFDFIPQQRLKKSLAAVNKHSRAANERTGALSSSRSLQKNAKNSRVEVDDTSTYLSQVPLSHTNPHSFKATRRQPPTHFRANGLD